MACNSLSYNLQNFIRLRQTNKWGLRQNIKQTLTKCFLEIFLKQEKCVFLRSEWHELIKKTGWRPKTFIFKLEQSGPRLTSIQSSPGCPSPHARVLAAINHCNALLISNQISKDLDCYKGWRSPSFQAAASLVAPQSSALAGYPAMRIVISEHFLSYMARFLSTEKDEDGDDGDICNDGVGSPDCWWCSVWPRCPSLPSTEGPAG